MNGFSKDWLALREPADHAAVNHHVRGSLLAYLAAHTDVSIVDLGCGTGSNFRNLAPEINCSQSWTLVDNDTVLLKHAETLNRELISDRVDVAYCHLDFSDGDINALAANHDLVTAAALFDLVSEEKITRMVGSIAKAGAAFYTVLTYDGIAAWLPETPAATELRRAFNRHQRSDKGFGPATGPDAPIALRQAFEDHDYTIVTGKSPWILDEGFEELRRETDRGWVAAAVEADGLIVEDGEAWLDNRANDPDAITIVGHADLLALPPARRTRKGSP